MTLAPSYHSLYFYPQEILSVKGPLRSATFSCRRS